ncbi:translation initiation factor IF-2-like [Ictidomys tridecemlineatus]|nr:translation initiation factor IF-2-like [Ictidomys tridecemlineatus]
MKERNDIYRDEEAPAKIQRGLRPLLFQNNPSPAKVSPISQRLQHLPRAKREEQTPRWPRKAQLRTGEGAVGNRRIEFLSPMLRRRNFLGPTVESQAATPLRQRGGSGRGGPGGGVRAQAAGELRSSLGSGSGAPAPGALSSVPGPRAATAAAAPAAASSPWSGTGSKASFTTAAAPAAPLFVHPNRAQVPLSSRPRGGRAGAARGPGVPSPQHARGIALGGRGQKPPRARLALPRLSRLLLSRVSFTL